MKTMKRLLSQGFTLIEMLLVLTIVSAFIYASVGYIQQRTLALSIDRASAQMQQILNAGLAYYVSNQAWPASIATLQAGGYLPNTTIVSPWASSYTVSNSNALFSVALTLPSALRNGSMIGKVLAGKLPLASSSTAAPCPPLPAPCPPAAGSTTITASVNIPGQNLNNATAVNFTGIYHNGGCVPVPRCPTMPDGTAMVPTIMVTPGSVSGMNDQNHTGSTDVYPISSFTAYATGPTMWSSGISGPPSCSNNYNDTSLVCYAQGNTTPLPSGNYWRVCLQVTTAQGNVQWNDTTGQYATVVAVTRCSPPTESSGSGMSVWSGS